MLICDTLINQSINQSIKFISKISKMPLAINIYKYGNTNLCNYIQQIQKYYKQFLLVKSLVGYTESEIPLMASDLRDIAK